MKMLLLAAGAALAIATASGSEPSPSDWAMNATAIEACSCPMFCQCYFNGRPAGHLAAAHGPDGHKGHGAAGAGEGLKHFCKANLAYRINKGHYGATRLDGAKFWVATDLGGDFSGGEMDWAVIYVDKALTVAQKAGIAAIFPHLFRVKWKSLTTAEAAIDTWETTEEGAVALLDGGKTGEVRLKRKKGMTGGPVVMTNLRYWGAARNDGFVMMPNEIQAYRAGANAFETRGTNGFMVTFDLSSADVKPDRRADKNVE